MNKSELIAAIAESAEMSKSDAAKALDAFTSTITNALAKKEQIVIVGFGTFKTTERAARTGRNPQTGKAINIAAATVPCFKAGSGLKSAVN